MIRIERLLPFVAWFPMDRATLRSDIVAGVTVALVLVPQSMAYAQLAGLPSIYGLYTAFLPVLVGALFGSSRQLATGPVAVVSLLTASALTPIAAQGSAHYIALAVTLAFLVGFIQLALGAFRLGVLVNFLSHPVIAGFTSAAAIIIALSQLNKILGVPTGRSSVFLADIWGVVQQAGETHLPSLAFGAVSFAAMLALRRLAPGLPGVLIVVACATAVSAAVGFEKETLAGLDAIEDDEARRLASDLLDTGRRVAQLSRERSERIAERAGLKISGANLHSTSLGYQIDLLTLEIDDLTAENRLRMRGLRKLAFEQAATGDGGPRFRGLGDAPQKDDVQRWRIRSVGEDGIRFGGGGEVVGAIPKGLPSFSLPGLDWSGIRALFSTALVIALVGFMEAVSIGKGIAAKTRRRLDANQELIGQGLANIVGSMTSCFPASGSFSRSAVNFAAGARTGLASVATASVTVMTLLFLTPLLYHLPQAVLAAVIMLAVTSLINIGAIAHAWRAHRRDGAAGAATFVATLAFAPQLDFGILFGAGLAVVLHLLGTMRPRVAILGRHADGTLRDAAVHGLPLPDHVVAVRFDGQLYFANVPYFEDFLLGIPARFPKVRQILIVGDGINQIDASGEETVRLLVERLRENGISVSFSGLKKQVLDVLAATGTLAAIGEENCFVDENQALEALAARIADPDFGAAAFPLRLRQGSAPE